MFARVTEANIYWDKKNELIDTVRREVIPILKKQPGFVEMLPLFPEAANEKAITVTLWTEKHYAEKFAKEVFPKVEQILKPYLATVATVKMYNVETTLCEHLVGALTANV